MVEGKLSGDAIVVKIDETTHRDFKVAAAKNNTTMSEVLRSHIISYVAASKGTNVIY